MASEIMDDVWGWEQIYQKLKSQPKDPGGVQSDTTGDLIVGGVVVLGVVGGAACVMSVICGAAVLGAEALRQSMFGLAG